MTCNGKMEQTGPSYPKQQKSEKRYGNGHERNERPSKRRNNLFSIGQKAMGFNYSKEDSIYISETIGIDYCAGWYMETLRLEKCQPGIF